VADCIEIGRVVRKTIFPEIKFANSEKFFDYQPVRDKKDGSIGMLFRRIKSKVATIGANEEQWWIDMKKAVKDALQKKRGTVCQAIKIALLGKLARILEGSQRKTVANTFCLLYYFYKAEWKKDKTAVPSLEDLQKMRQSFESWKFLCDKLLSAVIGAKAFNQNCAAKKVTEFTNETDIAFILLILENNWENWDALQQQLALKETQGEAFRASKLPKTKWTSSSSESGHNPGWDHEAYQRYNELVHQELHDRKHGVQVEGLYRTYQTQKDGNKRRKLQQLQMAQPVCSYISQTASNW